MHGAYRMNSHSKKIAEIARSEDDLSNVFWPIQAFNEFCWVRLPRRSVDRLQCGYLDPQENLACRIGDKEQFVPWHLFKDLQDVLKKMKN